MEGFRTSVTDPDKSRSGLKEINRASHWLPAGIGAIAGMTSGLLGVGGGFLIVPLQVMWTHTSQLKAGGTALAGMLPIALIAALAYYLGQAKPQVDLGIALVLMFSGMVGAYVGARASRRVPDRALKIVVVVLLISVGATEVYDAIFGSPLAPDGYVQGNLSLFNYVSIMLAGVAIGILSGLIGIGGGIFLVPTLVIGFGMAHRTAQGTSLVALIPIAATGALAHYRRRNVNVRSAAWIALTGSPASLLGAALALRLPEQILQGLFGLFLFLAAQRMWPRRGAIN